MIKLASEKSFNRGFCPVVNLKGKTVKYPFIVQHKNFIFRSDHGILGAKQLMVMDIIGTRLIHYLYKNTAFSDRIPNPNDARVKDLSGKRMSYKLLRYVTDNLSSNQGGRIPEPWYDPEGRLYEIDKVNTRIKKVITLSLNDGKLRKELPFLRKYSSLQIQEMIMRASECVLQMNFPIRYYDGKDYKTFIFNNYGLPSRLFSIVDVKDSKKSTNGNVLEREYIIRLDTILGYMFAQNTLSCYTDLVPGKFYDLSDYAQLFHRIFVLPYFKDVKNNLSIDEIRTRLNLKTADTYMVRGVINRILTELADNHFLKDPKEEKVDGKYRYRYVRNSWKEIVSGEEDSETDLVTI